MARRRWKTLYGLSCGQGEREGKRWKEAESEWYGVTRLDAGLATRIHVCSQCDYVPRKKKEEKEKKGVRARGVKVKVIYCVHE